MTNNKSCTVCTEPYNRFARRTIKCVGCAYECCGSCVERYLEVSKNQPQCMQCHRPWNNQFVIEAFGRTAARRITQTKKESMFQLQKSLFPHTQEYIQILSESEEMDKEVNELKKEMQKIKDKIVHVHTRHMRVHRRKNDIERDFLQYFQRRDTERANGTDAAEPSSSSSDNKDKRLYVRPCGKLDCKGFISSKGVCGLCNTEYCRKCLQEKKDDEEEHVCDPNDLLSVEAIKKDSKPCPSCSTMIHRISGCPDMFCTSCFTAFNWNNLQIDHNGNSNPMYYRWIRDGAGSNFRDVPDNCNQVHFHHVIRSVNFKKIASPQLKKCIESALQSLHHTERDIWRHFQGVGGPMAPVNFETATLNARAKYMRNQSTEENFKTQLMRINKAKEFNDNLQQSCNLIRGYRNDMMYNIVYTDDFDPMRTLREFVEFAAYMNRCYRHIRNVFYKNSTHGTTFVNVPNHIHQALDSQNLI